MKAQGDFKPMDIEDAPRFEIAPVSGGHLSPPLDRPAASLPEQDGDATLAPDHDSIMDEHSSGTTSNAIATGQILDHYRVLSLLGKGGMGEVYAALDLSLQRKVAIKLLPLEFTGDQHRVRRFTQEARAASGLSHPNIVSIYGFGECEFGQYLVMELVEGRSLRDFTPLPLDFKQIGKIGSQVAHSLQATHASGIVHRDIKPDNIMVRPDGLVKVLDFGIARLIGPVPDAMETAVTMPGARTGTPKYMSPEQVRGEWLTTASDIFSLGIVLYELATGKHPFEADTLVGYMHSILSRQPIAPYKLNPAIPSWLESVLMRMLEKDSERRCTVAEVVQVFTEREVQPSAVGVPVGARPRRFVGRRSEMADLQTAMQRAAHGPGMMLSISGEAGLGKTTLIEEFLQDVSASDRALIAKGHCSERLAGSGAYLPILEVLESLLSGVERESAAAAMKAVAPTWYGQLASAAVTQPSQDLLKHEFAALLHELSLHRPMVIFLDDVHWADISTTDLLSHIGSQLERMHVLVVVTFRTAEIHSARHPFLQLQRELQTRGLARELELGFFGLPEIHEYIETRFPDHRFPDALAQKLEQRTEGNPLFVADLLRYLQERGAILNGDGHWTLGAPAAELLSGMPDSVHSMVQRKMEQLGEFESKLLLAASVQGYDFNAAVVAHAIQGDPADVEDGLAKLEQRSGFIRLLDEHELPDRTLSLRFRFVHVLYQDAFYASLRPARRGALSRDVAKALLHFHGAKAGKIAAQLAALFECARDFQQAAEHYGIAAQNALVLFASSEAESLARRGIECVQSLPESDSRDRAELGLQQLLGLALRNLKTHSLPEAAAIQRRVLELAERLNDYATQFVVHYSVAMFFSTHQKFEPALREAEQCLRIAQQLNDPRMFAAAHSICGDVLTHLGRLSECRRHLEAVSQTYDPDDAPFYARFIGADPQAHAKAVLATVLYCMGYPDAGREMIGQAARCGEVSQNPIAQCLVNICAIIGFKNHRDRQVLHRASEDLISICNKIEFQASVLYFGKFGQGWSLVLDGNPAEGLALVEEAVAEVRAIEIDYALAMIAFGKVEAMRIGGRTELALQFLDEHLPAWEQAGQLVEIPDLLCARGECLLEISHGNSAAEAEKCFRRSMKMAAAIGARLCELKAASSLADLLIASGRRQEAADALAPVYAWFTEGAGTPALERARTILQAID